MSIIVFTLCSNNYLAHAKTLGDSILKHNHDVDFVIGLVDKYHPDIDYTAFKSFKIIPCLETGFQVFNDMINAYNVIEFNTAVKPYYFHLLFNRNPNVDKIYYIDPDIVFYAGLEELNALLNTYSILLTPHITLAQKLTTTEEIVALRHGHFNLGFLGLSRSPETDRFLNWWMERLHKHCVIDKPKGLFVDQKWMNLAPLLFDSVYNFKNHGYNMAWWNFDERKLIDNNGKYYVNNLNTPLIFFHFSGYKPGSEFYTGRINDSIYALKNRPDIIPLFNAYNTYLRANNFDFLSKKEPLLQLFPLNKNKQKSIVLKLFKKLFKLVS